MPGAEFKTRPGSVVPGSVRDIIGMRKPGTDPDNVQISDVLCDFCGGEWTLDPPLAMVEGHQGSCICGKCLSVAYRHVVLDKASSVRPGYRCTMCLEERPDPGWESPISAEKSICKRCINQAAGALSKDKESGWSRPV